MSFGADGPAAFRHGTRLIRKILEGRRPKDIPIEQSTKFELVINNKAAKAMGLKIPESFLARADEQPCGDGRFLGYLLELRISSTELPG